MNLTLVIDEDDAETCKLLLQDGLKGYSYERNGGFYTHFKEGLDAYLAALAAAIEAAGGKEEQARRREAVEAAFVESKT